MVPHCFWVLLVLFLTCLARLPRLPPYHSLPACLPACLPSSTEKKTEKKEEKKKLSKGGYHLHRGAQAGMWGTWVLTVVRDLPGGPAATACRVDCGAELGWHRAARWCGRRGLAVDSQGQGQEGQGQEEVGCTTATGTAGAAAGSVGGRGGGVAGVSFVRVLESCLF